MTPVLYLRCKTQYNLFSPIGSVSAGKAIQSRIILPAVLIYTMPGTITTSLLNWRATADQRGTIVRAASACGMTMSDLMRAAALEYAAKKIEEKER